MTFIERWITGFRFYLINIILIIISAFADDFNKVLVFNLTPADMVNLIAIFFYSGYLLLIVAFIHKERQKKQAASQST
ncbi:hypothetical protein [Shewanella xiamenensis]|uniref:Phenylalanyl-tRNA synthetase subunit alpha n=1 Tax=Shewanella xiamenensis TaxID=332186 RepID=A0ABT6U9Q2_9GAMM|nr:hypothetical protein [Shewanella xiamenensis]MDI5830667.1 hypothetical protein [Shewanella xiamenensis]